MRKVGERIERFLEEDSTAKTVMYILAVSFMAAFGFLSIDAHNPKIRAGAHSKMFVIRFASLAGFFLLLALIRMVRDRKHRQSS
jgi:hypothetical protein